MSKEQFLITVDITEDADFSLEELAEICGTSTVWLRELIEHGVLEPKPLTMQFDLIQLRRAQTALRLSRDLEVNHAGIALILDLLEEIETLRAEAEIFRKHFHELD